MKHPMGKFILAILLISACLLAFGQEKPDLIGGDVKARGLCKVSEKAGLCFKVEKFSTMWLVMLDAKGERFI